MVVVVGRERGGHDNARGGGEGDVAVDGGITGGEDAGVNVAARMWCGAVELSRCYASRISPVTHVLARLLSHDISFFVDLIGS
jgi:hypothetical protein